MKSMLEGIDMTSAMHYEIQAEWLDQSIEWQYTQLDSSSSMVPRK